MAIRASARFDETGTDGRSPYVIVAGAVATAADWDGLEAAWNGLLKRSHASAFHTKEFQHREDDFSDWSNFKAKRFTAAQEKIVEKHTTFTVAIGIDRAVHAAIKKEMRGVRGFKADSDYGFCFRVAMMVVCDQVEELNPGAKVAFMLEDGAAGAADAAKIYSEVSHMTAPWQPSGHAHMLAGFSLEPKGRYRSLEAADFIAGRAMSLATPSGFGHRKFHIPVMLNHAILRQWHQGMLDEKERRRAFHAAKRISFLKERSS